MSTKDIPEIREFLLEHKWTLDTLNNVMGDKITSPSGVTRCLREIANLNASQAVASICAELLVNPDFVCNDFSTGNGGEAEPLSHAIPNWQLTDIIQILKEGIDALVPFQEDHQAMTTQITKLRKEKLKLAKDRLESFL